MNLMAQYDAAIQRNEIDDNPRQRDILAQMQRLDNELTESNKSWFSWLHKKSIKGLYIYGPVGVGKTYLVDLFYQYVGEKKKARFHFHHFMQQIDFKLRQLQGHKDPLRLAAKEIAQSTRLLCFDEFLVHDVAYAMILAELFKALQANGVILVVSSNTRPDDLYLNGVQRDRFLPAIEIIKTECDVLQIPAQKDYRMGHQPLVDAYLYPLTAQTEQAMERQFLLLSKEAAFNGSISVQGRDIPYLRHGGESIWFSFDVICNLPRSQLDYLELADRYNNIFVSGIPCLTVNHTLQTIMFIHFIDVMYDRGINIIISAEVPIENLYVQGEMKDTFKRTLSRLMEMQSVDYLSRHPRRIVQNMV